MTRRRIACVTLGAALDLIATAACAQTRPESRYTPLTLARPHCVPDPGPAEGFSCKGLAGWTLDIGFPAFGASLGFVRGKRRTPAHVATDGHAVAIDGLPGKTANVEWRGVTKNGAFEPYAAILRVLAVEAAQWQEMIESGSPSLDVKRAQILVVTRLG
ncbi:MAG: hypothetical protein JWN07_408, partial [Hyphomicrobiales bacterium]|nr:hypothetical protein [Hyphomicrobiales bacterium]